MDTILRHGKGLYTDFSFDLRDAQDWRADSLKELSYLSNITALAVEAVAGLLAVGTSDGIIHIFGSPASKKELRLRDAAPIKFLQFASSAFKLVCVDRNGYLHVWDLNVFGHPELEASKSFRNDIQSMSLSPSHTHVFLSLQTGRVVTYDLLCLRTSPYVIPNMWKVYEDKMLASGLRTTLNTNSLTTMDMLHHPRNLNLVFIAYAGGVALYDLTKQVALHHYELALPPGAPGGIGYHDHDLLQYRFPPVTALSIHPSGHFFAVGYTDGCIAFWAVDDEDKPIQVRTLTDTDVNIADGEKLADILSPPASAHTSSGPTKIADPREPIFKIAWSSMDVTSDPRGGPTIFTVLGGLRPQDGCGVSVLLFPAFAPSAVPPSSPNEHTVHASIRAAMRGSLEEARTYFYSTSGSVQDFLLIPRDSPHFSGTHDPVAILLLSSADGGARSIEGKEFPPTEFSSFLQTKTRADSESGTVSGNAVEDGLASTLQDMQLVQEPRSLSLPTALWNGADAILDGDIIHVEKEAYGRLVQAGTIALHELPVRGGVAWADAESAGPKGMKFAKYQPHRLLITHHRNLTIRFQDISPQLLIGSESSPLGTAYPASLPFLTIELPLLLSDPCVATHRRPVRLENAEIQSVQLTTEASECAVTLKTGHVVVYAHADEARAMSAAKHVDDAELLPLTHLATPEHQKFQPVLLVDDTWGSVSVCEMSDVGFLAIAYNGGALLIIDMRGPTVILREGTGAKAQNRHSVSFHLHSSGDSEKNPAQSLKWTCCGHDKVRAPRLRLLASYRSGATRVYSLARSSSTRAWTVDEDVEKLEGAEHPLRRASFIISGKTGAACAADRASLADALRLRGEDAPGSRAAAGEPHCFWVSVGARGARCVANLAGQRVGKAEWGKGRSVECAEIITKSGSHALVALTSAREVLVFALPTLEQMHTFQLPVTAHSAACMDDTGDFVDWTFDARTGAVSRAALGTLFGMHRPCAEPLVDFAAGRRAVPPAPQPAPLGPPSLFGTLLSFQRGATGEQIDGLLAGPDRPLKTAAGADASQRQPESRAQGLAAQGARVGGDLYNSLTAAISERGEMLSDLEEHVRSLEEGSRSMVSQAKKFAAEQSGRRWFGF